jgi:hypothetical protein
VASLFRTAAALFCVASLLGCDVTPEKIARWKETEKGPGKLRETVKQSSQPAAIRAQALTALAEIGMSSDALADLKALPATERQAVAKEAAPRLIAVAKGAGGEGTTRAMREAKDALFTLRDDAAADDKARIDDALIAWTTADLVGRASQGGHASEKILTAIGARAQPRLLELTGAEGPNQLYAALLVSKIADEPGKARAAEMLVESARRVLQRTRDVPDGLLKAIGQVGGPRATAFLIDQAEHGTDIVRERALLALGQGASLAKDPAALAAAIRVCSDKKAPGKVREAAFQAAEKVGAAAVPGLTKLVDDADEITRWRAVEAALAAGKAPAVPQVLEALSTTRAYKKEDLDSYVVHDLKLIGPSVLPALKELLKSKSWVARVSAVRGIAAMGSAADAQSLAAVEADGAKVNGFPGGATVGSEAKAAKAALLAKR